jgi:hypothetical protein
MGLSKRLRWVADGSFVVDLHEEFFDEIETGFPFSHIRCLRSNTGDRNPRSDF